MTLPINRWAPLCLATLSALSLPAAAPATEFVHASGLRVTTDAPFVQPVEESAEVAAAMEDALTLAAAHPDDLALPYFDAPSGQVVLGTVTAAGMDSARSFVAARPAVAQPNAQSPQAGTGKSIWRIEQRANSQALLTAISDEAIDARMDGVPHGELISQTEVDNSRDQVMITVRALDDQLLNALAARYGTGAIAITVDATESSPQNGDRQHDRSPFFGGATFIPEDVNGLHWGWCTTGIPWMISSTVEGMLTAGHCALGGQTTYPWTATHVSLNENYPVQYLGQLPRSRVNFIHGIGTTYFPGQNVYRGDVGLIQITTPSSVRHVANRIYVGGVNSNTSRVIGDMWGRSPHVGDRYCIGGVTTGEQCGWSVTNVGINHTYSNGEIIRNAVRGVRQGACTQGGDSGAPVYTVWADGRVSIKGIHNGGGGGGSDHFGGPLDACFGIFTDVRVAYFGLPGWVKTQ